jgi:hypothetical protein
MNVTPATPSFMPPQMPPAQPPFLSDTAQSSGTGNSMGVAPVPQPASGVQLSDVMEGAEVPLVKSGKCWKCSVDTHATKDCKVQHYCIVCDAMGHPTRRCPTLKIPKPQAFVGGPACEESLCLRLPDSVFKAHLAPKGNPTALIKISGGSTSAVAIQRLMARICPLSSQWK